MTWSLLHSTCTTGTLQNLPLLKHLFFHSLDPRSSEIFIESSPAKVTRCVLFLYFFLKLTLFENIVQMFEELEAQYVQQRTAKSQRDSSVFPCPGRCNAMMVILVISRQPRCYTSRKWSENYAGACVIRVSQLNSLGGYL